VSVLASGCIVAPMDNPDVQSVFMTDNDRAGIVPIGFRSRVDAEVYMSESDCDSERYECEFDDVAE